MHFKPFCDGCGAMAQDVQLAQMDETQLHALRAAFAEHGVLFFRDQDLPPEQHHRLATRLGNIVLNKFFKSSDVHPEIAEVRKEKDQTTNIGGGWHTDHSYDQEPAMGSILVARDLPDSGGDTRFADLAKAFDALSPGLKHTLKGLRAVHSNAHLYGKDGYYSTTDLAPMLGGGDRVGEAAHPVVIKHPESGRDILYVNPGHTLYFEGWSREDSLPLLNHLYAHVDRPEFTCRFEWLPGSVAFWDNRRTWHFAQNDYQGQRRLMHRITLAGSALSPALPDR